MVIFGILGLRLWHPKMVLWPVQLLVWTLETKHRILKLLRTLGQCLTYHGIIGVADMGDASTRLETATHCGVRGISKLDGLLGAKLQSAKSYSLHFTPSP